MIFANGAETILVDFHMHTHRDKEFSYAGEDNSFVSAYISAMEAHNIRIGVITNHNKFDIGEYKALRREGNKHGILILPGVELSIKEGCNGLHTLIVFNPDEWIEGSSNHIDNFLSIVFRDIPNRDNANTRCQTDVTATLEELEKYCRDYFVVFAHVEQNNGLMKECDGGLIQSLSSTPYFRKRVLGVQKLRTHDNLPKLVSWFGYTPAMLDGSDPKKIDDIGKDRGASHIKLGELSYAALRYALLDHENRVFSETIPVKHSRIQSISFQGGKLNGCSLGLSPQLNTFIGIRGSGKSAVIEALRYVLQISPSSVDQKYKDELVKFILDSGGKVVITTVDEHGKKYSVSRINGENPSILDENGNDLAIPVSSVIRNPLYFGQKDLAFTAPGYEFELLHKLVGGRISSQENAISEQVSTLADKIRLFNSVTEIPEQIKELEEKARDIEHKLTVFKEKGISEKLEKQTACNADGVKVEDIIKEAKHISHLLSNFLLQYDTSAVSLSTYVSKYNKHIFDKLQTIIDAYSSHMAAVAQASEAIDEDIASMVVAQKELAAAIDEFKEEFAQIRRELHDDTLDIESYGKYEKEKTRIENEIARQKRELVKEKSIRDAIASCIRKRTDILLEIFNAYKTEIDRINCSQDELQISIVFKGDKNAWAGQLRTTFKGSGITETKYIAISDAFSDMVALVQDIILDNGKQLRTIITEAQYDSVAAKVRTHFESLISNVTPNLVEISYHGKPLSQHSLGQRASALVLFILSQNDNDVVIIDQPEDDLDNQVVYTEFIKKLKEKKYTTQFIFATHNANIPVLGDAERIVAADSTDGVMRISSGTIDSEDTHQQIVDIMEGGYEAFKRRNVIYSTWEKK